MPCIAENMVCANRVCASGARPGQNAAIGASTWENKRRWALVAAYLVPACCAWFQRRQFVALEVRQCFGHCRLDAPFQFGEVAWQLAAMAGESVLLLALDRLRRPAIRTCARVLGGEALVTGTAMLGPESGCRRCTSRLDERGCCMARLCCCPACLPPTALPGSPRRPSSCWCPAGSS